MLLQYNGYWNESHNRICEQGSKALHKLLTSFKNVYLPIDRKLYLFDVMVSPVLNYASEIWGIHKAENIEGLHLKFCKRILCVITKAGNMAVLGELGRYRFLELRQCQILQFWLKAISSDKDALRYKVYKLLCININVKKNLKYNWAFNVKNLLFNMGMSDVWYNQKTYIVPFDVLKQTIYNQFLQIWYSNLNLSSKMETYLSFKQMFCLENYLTLIENKRLRAVLTKFRISNHDLAIVMVLIKICVFVPAAT